MSTFASYQVNARLPRSQTTTTYDILLYNSLRSFLPQSCLSSHSKCIYMCRSGCFGVYHLRVRVNVNEPRNVILNSPHVEVKIDRLFATLNNFFLGILTFVKIWNHFFPANPNEMPVI